MVVTLAFCNRDVEIVLPLFNWMAVLGDYKPRHTLLLCPDPRCPKNAVQSILDAATPLFADVRNIPAKASIDGWPQGANYMFQWAATYLASVRGLKHFLWLEPDSIPLKKGWLDQLEDEYLSCGKPFLGDRVEVENIPLHMSGVGVYPNPLVNHAGEAMRCFDTAFDMAAKDQIVSNAHFTDLIEHAWKHPSFTDPDELKTQISPKSVLFHASKDGSLIKLLEEQQRSEAHAALAGSPQDFVHVSAGLTVSNEGANPSPLPTSFPRPDLMRAATHPGPVDAWVNFKSKQIGEGNKHSDPHITTHDRPTIKEPDKPGSPSPSPIIRKEPYSIGEMTKQPVYDIFIRTYPLDYPWLQFCLRSIAQYARGFRKIWIVSPEKPVHLGIGELMRIDWKVMNEEAEDGYLSQQIHKLYADTITNYEADYILHIDSDTLFTRPVTPESFFSAAPDGKQIRLIWYYTPYEHTDTPWKVITQKFLGEDPPHEFMRRLPMMIPSWLYPELRTFCFGHHKMNLGDYIRAQPYREFSEFNALGAYAWFHANDKFHWVNTMKGEMPPPFARQFFSWGGLTEEVKAEIQNILSGDKDNYQKYLDLLAKKAQQEREELERNEASSGVVDKENTVGSESATPSFNGEETPGDHVRWLADYASVSPSRRQYVMTQLKKARLVKLKRGRNKKRDTVGA